jgi:hypothetical protein
VLQPVLELRWRGEIRLPRHQHHLLLGVFLFQIFVAGVLECPVNELNN